jgi:hypothetical protein
MPQLAADKTFALFPVADQHGRLKKEFRGFFSATFCGFESRATLPSELKTSRQIVAGAKKLEPRCGMGARQRGSGHGYYFYSGSFV